MLKKFALALVLVSCAVGGRGVGLPSPTDCRRSGCLDDQDVSVHGKWSNVFSRASHEPVAAFPRYYVKSLTRIYDFTAGAMRDEMVRTQGEAPPRRRRPADRG